MCRCLLAVSAHQRDPLKFACIISYENCVCRVSKRLDYRSNFLITKAEFLPPNPNEFFSATSIVALRATFGT